MLARRPLVGLDVVHLDRVEEAERLKTSTPPTHREDLAVEGGNRWGAATLPH